MTISHMNNSPINFYKQQGQVAPKWPYFIFLLLFGYNFVLPHSNQIISAIALSILALISILTISGNKIASLKGIFFAFLIASLIHLGYVIYGFTVHQDAQILLITVFTYFLMPLIWIIISAWSITKVNLNRIVNIMAICTILACGSVAIYFYLFLNFGSNAVSFFVKEANVVISDGKASAAMYVYATLIFSSSAFFAAPNVIRNVPYRIVLLVVISATALTSGRSALIVSLAIGTLIGVGMTVIAALQGRRSKYAISLSTYVIILLAVTVVATILDALVVEIDLVETLNEILEKIILGGGVERTDQYAALIQGISETSGLGAGHGIGVSLVRDYSYPWRYELFFLSIIYRVGIFSSAIILIPYIMYVSGFMRRALYGKVESQQTFLFGGFCASMFAAATNPYPESFIFQWCYIFPIIAFFLSEPAVRKHSDQSA